MTTETSVLLQVVCPTCAAAVGQQCISRGKPITLPHAPRRSLAIHEHDGPLEGDVVYLDAQKYRVVVGSESPGLIRLRIRRVVVRNARREDLSFDVVAGLWRRK